MLNMPLSDYETKVKKAVLFKRNNKLYQYLLKIPEILPRFLNCLFDIDVYTEKLLLFGFLLKGY